MTREDVTGGLLVLKEVIATLKHDEKDELFAKAAAVNPWYTENNIQKALDGIVYMLEGEKLKNWLEAYPQENRPVRVGLIMAGNIPLVGFHDLLCTLLAGHTAVVKLSSQDEVLPKFLFAELVDINPEFKEKIEVVDKLNRIDAVIATGSDNSSRYFHKYFKDYPNIIRKNRTSAAVLDGSESAEELTGLADDIFSYFGMGCRNVSKIYIPTDYKVQDLLPNFEGEGEIVNHPKYFNNYEYNKAIYLVNKVEHFDNGFALFTESEELVSPLAVVYYERYASLEELEGKLALIDDKLQCVVGKISLNRPLVPFGKAQQPELDDYADNIDTMKFLTGI